MKKRFLVPIAVVSALASSAAMAQADWRMPWQGNFWGYAGVNAGQSKFRGDCSTLFDCDRKDSAWKVHVGGNFNNLIGVELGYTDFGRMRSFGGESEAQAANVSLTAGVPLGDRFAIFAKGGAVYGRTDVSASPTTFRSTGSRNEWGTTWGAGATFAITRNLQARVDWDRYKLEFAGGNDRDVDLLSAGLQMRF
ncbi:MAG TPA: outer membrane beta-barrel protein [Opitutaceae bacterium]|nr:outer membrane beta-barrel protein [Opitutaceae bacterium]